MIIDFHTHIFPEKIAARALSRLASVICLEPSMDGTVSGLKASMARSFVDVSVVLPVVTSLHQFDSILFFASMINETCSSGDQRLISLAGIHPADENFKEHLALIKREGFAGVKIHPSYQGVCFSDIRCKRLLYAASELGLLVITHAGSDPYTPNEEFCTPDMIVEVLNEVAPEKLILAHMGNNGHYQEAEEKICGKNVYLDTAYSIMQLSDEQFVRMIRKHGADKILFGSDAPWTDQADCVKKLQNCGLMANEQEKIFSGNARSLLGL